MSPSDSLSPKSRRSSSTLSAAQAGLPPLVLAGLLLFCPCVQGQDPSPGPKPKLSATDPDLAYIKGLLKDPARPLSSEQLEDAAQRLDDMILDRTYPDSLEETVALLKDKRLRTYLAARKRDVTLDKIAEIRQLVAKIKQAREAEKSNGDKPAEATTGSQDAAKPDAKVLELALFDRVYEVFLNDNLKFKDVLKDYLKFHEFLQSNVTESIKDGTLKRNLASSLNLLSQQAALEAQRAQQPNTAPLPTDKPTRFTVRNNSTTNNPLQVEVFGETHRISPKLERAFRFADRFMAYTDIDYSGTKPAVRRKPYPVTQSGTYKFKSQYSQQEWSWTNEFEPKKPTEVQETPGEKPGEKPADKPGEKPADKPGEKPADKPGEKPADEPADKPSDKPADKPSDEPADKPADKPSDKPTDKPSDKPSNKPGVKETGLRGRPSIPQFFKTSVAALLLSGMLQADDLNSAVMAELGVDTTKPPTGLKEEALTDWTAISKESFYGNPSFKKVYEDFKNRGTRGGSLDPGRYPKPVEVANLYYACDELAQLCVEAANESKGKDRLEGRDRFNKIEPFWQHTYDLMNQLLETASFDPNKQKDEERKKTYRQANERLVRAMRARRSDIRKIDNLVAKETMDQPTPSKEGTPPAPDPVLAGQLERLTEDFHISRAVLARKVEEVSRARSQSYTSWRPDPSKQVFTSSFRYRPAGTDRESVTPCLYFTSDPDYVYYLSDVRTNRYYVSDVRNCLSCINGQWMTVPLDYGRWYESTTAVCWGRYNLRAGPFSDMAWEWVPQDRRKAIVYGARPSPDMFDTASSLPNVPRTQDLTQFLLWPSQAGLPQNEAIAYAAPAAGTATADAPELPPPPVPLPASSE